MWSHVGGQTVHYQGILEPCKGQSNNCSHKHSDWPHGENERFFLYFSKVFLATCSQTWVTFRKWWIIFLVITKGFSVSGLPQMNNCLSQNKREFLFLSWLVQTSLKKRSLWANVDILCLEPTDCFALEKETVYSMISLASEIFTYSLISSERSVPSNTFSLKLNFFIYIFFIFSPYVFTNNGFV